jgi:hypothetical protein
MNVVDSLHRKLLFEPLKRRARRLLVFYLIYGVLSIIASLGFSIVITSRTQAIRDSDLEILISRRTAIESKMSEMVTLRQSANISSYMEYPLWVEANTDWQDYRQRFEEADLVDSQLLRDRNQIADRQSEEWRIANTAFQAQRTFITGLRNQMNRADAERLRIQNSFEESKNDMAGQLALLDGQLHVLIQQAGISAPDGSTALIMLQEIIQQEEIRIIKEKGMAYMFEGFSNLLKGAVTPETIKIIILLITSFLLELTIYQCSPDVKINRWILKYFKKSLPKEKSFNEILAMYEDEDGNYVEPEPSPPPVIEKPKKKVTRKPRQPKVKIVEHSTEQSQEIQDEVNDGTILHAKNIAQEVNLTIPIKEAEPEDYAEVVHSIPTEFVKEIPMEQPTDEIKYQEIEVIDEAKSKQINFIHVDQPIDPPQLEEIPVENSKNTEEKKSIHYRFGRTTQLIADKLCEFINLCVKDSGQFLIDPEDAATQLKISKRVKEVFLEHLSNLKLGSRPLIYKNKNSYYYSNYSAEQIIAFATEVIED